MKTKNKKIKKAESLKTYLIEARETIFYETKVKARSEEEARGLIFDGEVDFRYKDVVDSADFEVDEITIDEK